MKALFLMLAGVPMIAMAAVNEPSAAALDFLEKIRQGTVDLDPGKGTALSSHTVIEKRHEISRRLERMADDLGKGKLEAGEIKIDDDLAAVLVRDTGGFDPTRMRVFAIGLVKIKDQWLPAPLPASFENTGFGFVDSVRQRIASLESWMLRGQVTDLEQMRDQSVAKMKKEITASLDPKVLQTASPEAVLTQFFAACEKRDLPAILGFLGGLQESLPGDWSDRLRAADQAISQGKSVGFPWRLLIAPEVIRVRVEDEGATDEAPFSFGCIDPAGRSGKPPIPKLEMVHIHLTKDDNGLWKVDLPARFFHEDAEEEDEDADQEMREAFPTELRKLMPAAPAATLADAAKSLQVALTADHLDPLISLADFEGEPGDAVRSCIRAAQAWWMLHSRSALRHAVVLGSHEDGDSGVVAFQFFSPREPDRFDLRQFYFRKSTDGWLIIPGFTPTETEGGVKTWADNQAKTWRKSWQTQLLANSQSLDAIQAGNAPSEVEARKLVEAWLTAMRENDVDAALRLTVSINRPGGSARLLQNLGYELGSAQRENGTTAITTVTRGETWTAVGVKSEGKESVVFPLYLAVATPAGPRLLIETDLFGNASSGRELLNKSALGRVRDFSAAPVADELDRLFQNYREVTTNR